jgi:AraC-like DNA-binding protein
MEDRGGQVAWIYNVTAPDGGFHCDAEFVLCRAISFARGITHPNLLAQRAMLQGTPPPYRAELERVLRAPLEFGQRANALVFSRDALSLPVMNSPAQRAMIARLAELALEAPVPSGRLPEFLLDLIKSHLADGRFNMNSVAPQLGMSARTLQRHLQKERTNFQAVLDQARKEVSVGILRHGRQPYARIAARLGYSNVANFHRAFRRWFGQTPNQLRLRLMEESEFDPALPRPWPMHTGDSES